MKKASRIIIGILATLIGLYPIIYFLIDRQFGLLASKSTELLRDIVWNSAFYAHITLGGIALLIGWLQFSPALRRKNIRLHRKIGIVYIMTVFVSGLSSLYIALYATGGIISILGFFLLGVIWLGTTIAGFRAIKNGKFALHENFMVFSYAACFAAVSLRIWLPILADALGEFETAYRIVAWLCWVPNMLVAWIIVKFSSLPAKKPVAN